MLKNNKFWWLIVVLWCLLIAFATRNPFFTGDSTEQLLTNRFFNSELLNIVLRKAGHMVAFGLLAVFSWLALKEYKYKYLMAWTIATLYGAIDEWHQSFVPNRDGVFTDVLYNSSGAIIALIFIKLIVKYLLKENRKPSVEES